MSPLTRTENLNSWLFSNKALLHLARHSSLHLGFLLYFRFVGFFNVCLAEIEGHILTVGAENTCAHPHQWAKISS